MKKIDIHCHTTNRKVKDCIDESADLDTILEYMDKYEIEKTNLLATYFPHKSSGISNFRLMHWIKNKKDFFMFGSLDFEHYFFQGYNELEELAEHGLIKGVKVYTCYQQIGLDSEKFGKVVELARRYSLPLMFHCGNSYSSLRKYGRRTIANLVKASDLGFVAQDVNIIVDHMSKPFFDDLIKTVNRNPMFILI